MTVAKTTISTANLRTLLRDCAVHVRTLQQGHAALTDLQAFPGGRFGAMKYDEAMQESRSLQARIDAAVSVQAPLLKKLATLGNSVPDDSRIPQELHRRLERFADLRQDSVEELAGIQKLDGELTSLLAELDRVAPEEPSGGHAATGSAPVTPTQPSTVTGDRLVLPGRGPSPLLFIVAGLLAFAAAGASFLIRNRRERIIITPCPGCGADVSIDRATAGTTLACSHCEHEFTVDEADEDHRPRKASAPGPLLYGGVATGSLLLLAGLIIQLERATASPTEHSGYTLSDYPADLHFLREKAESGDPSAQYELGRFHDRGTDDFPADPREAALWYLTAAEGGNPTAQLAIGTLYDMGHGIAPDPQEAERWLTAAAEQGVVEAQKILGVLYLGKGGLPYEPERSIQWMTRAADQGDGEAMFHLSVAYHKGVEVAPDPETSERWLQRAVEADFGPAKEILRLRQANLEAQVDQLWRQVEDSMPRSSGYRMPGLKTRPMAIAGISTGALALIVALGIVMSGPGGGTSGNHEAAAIEKVLEQKNRVYRDAAKNFKGSTADAARHFARELQKIDTRNCPAEFRVAHQDLVNAWGTSIPYLAADTMLTSFLEGFVGGLTGDFSGVGRSSQQAELATQHLQGAHQSLHRIAVAYGAKIPTR